MIFFQNDKILYSILVLLVMNLYIKVRKYHSSIMTFWNYLVLLFKTRYQWIWIKQKYQWIWIKQNKMVCLKFAPHLLKLGRYYLLRNTIKIISNILKMKPIELFLPEGLQSPTLRLLHEVLWDYSRFHAGLPACYEASFSNHSSCDR